MKLMRSAAMIAIGKKLYDEGRKPENQRRMKEGIERLRAKRAARA
jgi:hypothetical protein